MKTNIATLIDRHTVNGLTIRAQTDSGAMIDIHVQDADAADAAKIYGGGLVRYTRRGSRWVYVTEADAEAAQ